MSNTEKIQENTIKILKERNEKLENGLKKIILASGVILILNLILAIFLT